MKWILLALVRTILTVLNSKIWLSYKFCVLVVDGVSEPVDFEASFNKQYVKILCKCCDF